jgi:nucleotide-binding universal stress UspA family protein
MFQKILLAWEDAHPPQRALAVATEITRVYGARLSVATLVADARHPHLQVPTPAALGGDYECTMIIDRHPVAGMLALAHEHGFDLVVVGHHAPERTHRVFTHDMARDLVRESIVPVLVVAEGDFSGARAPELQS